MQIRTLQDVKMKARSLLEDGNPNAKEVQELARTYFRLKDARFNGYLNMKTLVLMLLAEED